MKTEAEINWETLRGIIERDQADARARSKNSPAAASDVRADTFQRVLDSMYVLEFGLDAWRAKMAAEQASEVPGLAEHTQAAPVKYGDKVTGPRGSGTVVSTAQFNNASTVRYNEPRAFVIEQNTSLKLAEATQAACDTITKAASVDLGDDPDGDNEIPCTCRKRVDHDCPLHGVDHDTAEDRMFDEVRKLERQGRA